MGFLAVLISILLAAAWSALDFEPREIPYPNGPRSVPILGSLWFMSRLWRNANGELLNLARKYGGMCMLWFGSRPILVISKTKDALELMEKRGSIYSSRPAQTDFRAMAWPWRLIVTPAGEKFILLRKLYQRLLGPQQLVRFRKYQDYESRILLGNLLDDPERFLEDTERFALSVIFSAVYGIRLARLDHPVVVEFYTIWGVMLKYFQPGSLLVDYFPCLQKLPRFMQPWMNLAERLQNRETRLHKSIFQTLKRQVGLGAAPDCVGKALIELQDQEDIGDDAALNMIAMLISAGSETTSSILQLFFKIMALHPQVMRKAHQELDQVVGLGKMPDWVDEPSLPYIRGLIKEVHRWAPTGSLGVPHATTKDDEYEGRLIPQGTTVFPNLTALSRDEDRYSNANTFDPDRFLEDSRDALSSAPSSDHYSRDHFQYGFGRRFCQGLFVAEASLYIIISRVVWGFDISCQPGHKLDMSAKSSGLATKPKPFRVSIKSRSRQHEAIMKRSLGEETINIRDIADLK